MRKIFKGYNNIYKTSILFMFVLIISAGESFSQAKVVKNDSLEKQTVYQKNLWSAGIYGSFMLNIHNVNFQGLPTVPSCCPDYKNGIGYGPEFGGLFNYSLSANKNYSLELRLSYSNYGGLLKAQEIELMYSDPNTSVYGTIEHRINTSIHALNIEPLFKFKIFSDFYFDLGFSFGTIFLSNYEQVEELLEPADLLFENNERFRNRFNGDIPQISKFYTALNSGLSYEIFVGDKQEWYLAPELRFSYGLNDIIPGEKWNIYSIKLGLSLNYNERQLIQEEYIEPKPEKMQVVYTQKRNIDTVRIELTELNGYKFYQGVPSISHDTSIVDNIKIITESYNRTDKLFVPKEFDLAVSIDVSAIDKDDKEIQNPVFQVEEFLSTRMTPLLNYIFFDENSSEIPARYKKVNKNETEDFNSDSLFNYNTIEVYHELLNILGKRMNTYPKAELTLTGCNSDIGTEKGNTDLSKQRAESIKKYLVDVWNIQADRITIFARNLPAKESNVLTQEGIEENRRVEISSETAEILTPVIVKETLVETSILESIKDSFVVRTFKGFKLDTKVSPKNKISEWRIFKLQEDDFTTIFEGKNEISESYDWIFEDKKEISKILLKPVTFIFLVKDINGQEMAAKSILNIERKTIRTKQEKRQGDKKIDSYSLILFDYGSMSFTKANEELVKFVKNLIDIKSEIKVKGYSDKIGSSAYNKTLSIERAKAVANALDHPNVEYEGIGEETLLFNNDLPEGRFYCRTVNILVETPIQW